MSEIIIKAKEILKNQAPKRPSQFQLMYLLVNKEPTNQGRLWRIVDEIRSKMTEIESGTEQVKDFEDQIRIMMLDNEDLCNQNSDSERKAISLRRSNRQIQSVKKQIEQIKYIIEAREQEIAILSELYDKISTIEGIKGWDDPNAQLEYWEAKLGNEIAMRTALGMPQDLEVLRMAMSLPGESKLKNILKESIQRKMIPDNKDKHAN